VQSFGFGCRLVFGLKVGVLDSDVAFISIYIYCVLVSFAGSYDFLSDLLLVVT